MGAELTPEIARPHAKGTPPRGRYVTWKALGIALFLHASLLALAPLVPKPVLPRTPAAEDVRGDTFDIETTGPGSAPDRPVDPREPTSATTGSPPAAETPPPTTAKDERPAAAGEARAKVATVPKSEAVERGEPEQAREIPPPEGAPGAQAAPPGEGAPGAQAAPPADAFSPVEPGPPGGGVITGLGGTPVWAMPGVLGPPPPSPAAATAAPAAPETPRDIAGRVLSGSMHRKDQDIGIDLPAGGVVASTIASAVRSSEAPPDARATFEVRLGADGKVLGVRVVSSSAGNAATWERVARNAGAALGSRALAMSGDAAAKGATVTVKIQSKLVYPAGSKEKYDVAPVCVDEVIEEALNAVSDATAGEPGRGPLRDPAVNRPDPAKGAASGSGDGSGERRFPCIPIGIRGKGDLSNLGAHMQTVVSSSFKVTVPGEKPLVDVKKVDTRAPWSPPDPNKVQRIKPKRLKKKKRP